MVWAHTAKLTTLSHHFYIIVECPFSTQSGLYPLAIQLTVTAARPNPKMLRTRYPHAVSMRAQKTDCGSRSGLSFDTSAGSMPVWPVNALANRFHTSGSSNRAYDWLMKRLRRIVSACAGSHRSYCYCVEKVVVDALRLEPRTR